MNEREEYDPTQEHHPMEISQRIGDLLQQKAEVEKCVRCQILMRKERTVLRNMVQLKLGIRLIHHELELLSQRFDYMIKLLEQ